MLSNEEINEILNFSKTSDCEWIWVDLTTTYGPTKMERIFKEALGGDVFSHWSPTVPEGYLEIIGDKKTVIHWVIGESDHVLNISCVDTVDFDNIDKSFASTIIHNSVIRILLENF